MGPPDLRVLIATACHILNNEGHEHFHLGHVSARLAGGDRIVVKPTGLGLQEVTPADLAEVNCDGRQLSGPRPLHHEMPIHTEIYRKRPDVQCVVHTHPLHAAAFSAAAADFAMVSQDSVLFSRGIARFPSPRLIVTAEQGAAVAECLADRSLVLLKNHGLVIAAPTVEEATVLAVSFERSLQVQMAAQSFGRIDPIADEDVEAMADYFATSYDGRIKAMWDYLSRKVPDRDVTARAAGQ